MTLHRSISFLETPLQLRATTSGFSTRRVLGGRYALPSRIDCYFFDYVYMQRWIGSDAASQVDHMSGSYSTIVPGMNLRYYQDSYIASISELADSL